MATVPGQLIWEVVKKNNCFLVKQFGRGTAGVRFSKEPNNLYNVNSYKHSENNGYLLRGGRLCSVKSSKVVCPELTVPSMGWYCIWVKTGFTECLANKKTVTIQPAGKDQSVLLATTKSKKQNKPSSLLHKSVMKKEFPRMAKAVKNQVTDNYYRPDLTKAALARLSAVNRSLKVAKSGVKKRNRQALRIHGRK
ncbi:hypothetical protein Gogos_005248 [Gossypium gossypioides]|uniref:Ribosomal eL28/Mak16 domain-containing protein n=1 Tax=Gossypium gossypioides TaxID=34282 RepID=A0A7J9CIW6_GOSGO|nr:hypothetical protein [Gossypium gossypioides]